jgi:hypothetical protein
MKHCGKQLFGFHSILGRPIDGLGPNAIINFNLVHT